MSSLFIYDKSATQAEEEKNCSDTVGCMAAYFLVLRRKYYVISLTLTK